jgi:hypothetical protein
MVKAHLRCSGGSFSYEAATYEGLVEFNGEHGYTRARAEQVAQVPPILLYGDSVLCGSGSGESSGPGLPGARLRGSSFGGGRALSFQVNKNGPRAKMVFQASLKERRGAVAISRQVAGSAPPRAFRFDKRLRTATLDPPAPFSGTGSITRSRNSVSAIWTGGLALDFPGRRRTPLTGPRFHTTLVPARLTRNSGSFAEAGF